MPSDRLTRTDPSQATEAVLDVLAGTELSEAARKAEMDPSDLTDAVEIFRHAGTEALRSSSADSEWWQVNLHFAAWRMAEFHFLAVIMPLLRAAEAAGDIDDRHDIPLGRRELSVLLCTMMMRAAGLEWYEQADVWHRVITDEHRTPVNPMSPEKLEAITEGIGTLLRADHDTLLRPGGSLEPVKEWAAAFGETGRSLAEAVRLGTLDRGLRRILSLHVIFHWNRMGLTMHSQGVLALTARTVILGHSQDSSRPRKTSSGE
ncbi:thiopeptide-type bacteriocin biosynthesis protein [Streptomyces sp. NPDC020965]|uniref:thiopeptide-type bacteriocin biosynthesis protein n=1 Tax=Streptomyces sp. NPDC020965 TaxID=3365105 RepID=UPI0037A7CA89